MTVERKSNVITLPCAIGDTVYTNDTMQGWYLRKSDRPYEAKVVFIGINGVVDFMNVRLKDGFMLTFNFEDIGEKVFLTREDAQKALEKEDGGRNVPENSRSY